MPIDGADIPDSQFLKNNTARGSATPITIISTIAGQKRNITNRALDSLLSLLAKSHRQISFWQLLHQTLQVPMEALVARVCDNFIKVIRDGTNVLIDAPLIVVEYSNEALGCVCDIVERLEGNTVG